MMGVAALEKRLVREAIRASRAWVTNDIGGQELARAMYRMNEIAEQLEAAYKARSILDPLAGTRMVR